MLKNIALIASIISALTAVTTSLRALGRSRIGNLSTYLIVTIIWYGLSILFVLPLLIQKLQKKDEWLIPWILPYVILGIILWFIWQKITHSKNQDN
jgi:lysylphosphatidylglycerol synthetase-like protein (DUF2156 family)